MAEALFQGDECDPIDLASRVSELLEVMGLFAVVLTSAGARDGVAKRNQAEWLSLVVPQPWKYDGSRVPPITMVARLGEAVSQLMFGQTVRMRRRNRFLQHGLLRGFIDTTDPDHPIACRVDVPTAADLELFFGVPHDGGSPTTPAVSQMASIAEDPSVAGAPVLGYSEPGQGADHVWVKCGLHEPYRRLESTAWTSAGTDPASWRRPKRWENQRIRWLLPPRWGVGASDEDSARTAATALAHHISGL